MRKTRIENLSLLFVAIILVTAGCNRSLSLPSATGPNSYFAPTPMKTTARGSEIQSGPSTTSQSGMAELPATSFPQPDPTAGNPSTSPVNPSTSPINRTTNPQNYNQQNYQQPGQQSQNLVYRAQDGGTGSYPYPAQQQPNGSVTGPTTTFQQPRPPQQPGTFFDNTAVSPRVGAPDQINPLVSPNAPAGMLQGFPQNYADLDVYVQEAQTGRIMVGGAFNSDNGLTGQITIDEKNFDISRWPRNFREIVDGTAWRGAGQSFRMELIPGSQVQRYLVSFTEPYLFNSLVSFSASGYYYNRQYFDWDEQRLGGQFSLGYRLNHDLSVSVGTKLENVKLFNPRVNTSAQLNGDLGSSSLYTGFVSLTHDTRDHPFMATEGAYFQLRYQQAFGTFDYPRGDVDYRRYFLLYQRPDGSGRHTVNVGTRLGFSGAQTPVFENYFAGGFSSMRGFDFRGASPIEGGVRVGGEFQWLNTVEYMFPLTPDDMIKGVVFVDFGTVEEKIEINSENFRIAPGIGFRIHMPAAGLGGAPLAFDFAIPISDAAGDDRQLFTFYLGALR